MYQSVNTGLNYSNIANDLSNIGNIDQNTGTSILPTAMSQYTAGAEGVLTPFQQAEVKQNLGQMNLGTEATYGNLGLGGSTMEQQDLNANDLSSLALSAGLSAQSEQLGLSGLTEGLNFLTGATGAFGGAGNIYSNELDMMANSLQNLGNSNSGGGGLGGIIGDVAGIGSILGFL